MERMAGQELQICLDTSICIEILKDNIGQLKSIADSVPIVSSVTAFELMMRENNITEAVDFLTDTEILDFDSEAAIIASKIEKGLKKKGKIIGREDIFIAATAIANNCSLATLNVKDFSKIEGLKLVKLN
jgi:tRNA(fMet)-specific endonuclease VapC